MPHQILTLPAGPDDQWSVQLTTVLDTQTTGGWMLVAMCERTVRIEQPGGMSSATREEPQMVLVFYRP